MCLHIGCRLAGVSHRRSCGILGYHTPDFHTGYARISVLAISGQRQARDELAEDERPVLRRRAGGSLRSVYCFCHC